MTRRSTAIADSVGQRRAIIVEKLLYKMHEAATVLILGLTKTYELANAGSLRTVKVGRARRVPADALTEFVEGLQRSSLELEPVDPRSARMSA
jgi:excisionase family DNA binding protein